MTEPSPSPVRVLVVDDDPLARSGLSMMLGGASDIEVVGEAGDGSQVTRQVEQYGPDVVLMDIRMPVMDGLEATERLRRLPDAPQVLVLTTFDADAHVLRAMRAGAAGFLLKDTPPNEIVTAVRAAAQNRPVLSPSVLRRLIDRASKTNVDEREFRAREKLAVLSEREQEIAVQIGSGKTNAQIGASMFLSVPTVKTNVSAVLSKLQVNNRVQVALLVHDAGLLDEED
ncbi:MAG TPA: response regulator transcription factor [Candidatus Stackebrandtia faecavium]|nr:response regulator transcription factor [Candidatus Stackebrandtia faecavium]